MVSLIAGTVTLELRRPELDVRLGQGQRTVGAAMPVAPIDKDRNLATGVAHIRAPGSLLPMQPISGETCLPELSAYKQLGAGVFRTICLHHVTCS